MIPFEVIVPDVDETPRQHESPQALVERLAILKAQTVASKQANALVIGSDQVAVHSDAIVGKPITHERAVEQLKSASGKSVMLYTGLALINSASGRVQSEMVPYGVTFRTLSELQIETYLRKEQPYHCAGSVKSEGLGVALLERFDGEDPATLIGLPLIRLIRMLEEEGLAVI